MNRSPSFPHLFAQSKTSKCSSLRCGAPSIFCVPQISSFACDISLLEKPRVSNKLKSKEVYSSSSIPRFLRVCSPRTNTLKAC